MNTTENKKQFKQPSKVAQDSVLQRLPADLTVIEEPTVSIEEESPLFDDQKEPIKILDTLRSTSNPLNELIQDERLSVLKTAPDKFQDQELAQYLEESLPLTDDVGELEHFYLFALFTIIRSSSNWDERLSIKDLKWLCYLSGISVKQALAINAQFLQTFATKWLRSHPEYILVSNTVTQLYSAS